MAKIRLTLLGAGKIGEAIVALLDESGDYDLTIVVIRTPSNCVISAMRVFAHTPACWTTLANWLRYWRTSRS